MKILFMSIIRIMLPLGFATFLLSGCTPQLQNTSDDAVYPSYSGQCFKSMRARGFDREASNYLFTAEQKGLITDSRTCQTDDECIIIRKKFCSLPFAVNRRFQVSAEQSAPDDCSSSEEPLVNAVARCDENKCVIYCCEKYSPKQ